MYKRNFLDIGVNCFSSSLAFVYMTGPYPNFTGFSRLRIMYSLLSLILFLIDPLLPSDIDFNYFTGSPGPEIGSLSNLEHLYLLSFEVPTRSIIDLLFRKLNSNDLSGQERFNFTFSFCPNLSKLTYMYVNS